MREMVSLKRNSNNFDLPQLHKHMMYKDEYDVQAMCDILSNSGRNPFSDEASTGVVAKDHNSLVI